MTDLLSRIRRAIIIWKLSGELPGVLVEHHRLLTRSAMRCAYDMAHCASCIRDPELEEEFQQIARDWISLFDPTGFKMYKDELHMTIRELKQQVAALNRHCEEHGIPFDKIPF
jgi:hypothetical protein